MAEIALYQQVANTVAPGAFGLIQRGIGDLQQLIERLPLLGPMRQAGRQGDALITATAGDVARGQLRADRLQTLAGLTRIGAWQDQQKLLATDTKYRIGAAQVVLQVLCLRWVVPQKTQITGALTRQLDLTLIDALIGENSGVPPALLPNCASVADRHWPRC